MKILKLPVIRGNAPKARILSMNEYVKFIQFNLQQAFDKKAYAKWKKMSVVNVLFSIK
jgi:hypothetical protein